MFRFDRFFGIKNDVSSLRESCFIRQTKGPTSKPIRFLPRLSLPKVPSTGTLVSSDPARTPEDIDIQGAVDIRESLTTL